MVVSAEATVASATLASAEATLKSAVCPFDQSNYEQIRFNGPLPKKGALEADVFTVGSGHSTPHTLRLLRGLGIGLLRT